MERSIRLRTISLIITIFFLICMGITIRILPFVSCVRVIVLATMASCVITLIFYTYKLCMRNPKVFYPLIFFICLIVVWAVLTNKPIDKGALMDTYMHRLTTFNGVKYLKDGETSYGADASGIVRMGLWQAALTEGIRDMNPRLLNTRFWRFWWRDLSANDIRNGKYDYTYKIAEAKKLTLLNQKQLHRGDIAVTNDGKSLWIYIGSSSWTTVSAKDKFVRSYYIIPGSVNEKNYNKPVTLVRWRIFKNMKSEDNNGRKGTGSASL